MEDLIRKLHQQDEELRRRESRIDELRAREHLLQQTLTTAQRLAEEVKEHARKEAQIVLSEAELQGEKVVQNAQQKRLQLIKEIDDLKRTRQTFVQQLSSLLDTHKALLDSARGEPAAAPGAAPVDDNVSFLAPTRRSSRPSRITYSRRASARISRQRSRHSAQIVPCALLNTPSGLRQNEQSRPVVFGEADCVP